jgi:membrane associated rhomboid family serine protease
MSLEIQKETVEVENTEDSTENQQQITDVFPLYSAILIACLVIVSGVQFIVDSQDKEYDGYKSVLLAGFLKKAFVDGQYWRSLTSGVLHSGIAHLLFNSYAVYVFGKPFETLSNRSHLIIVFLLAVIGGDVLSLIFVPEGVSVGASGGIIGLLGYLTVYAFKRRQILSSALLKNLLINIGLIAFFGLVVMKNTDNYAHLGGFLAGAIYGLFQISSDVYKDPRIVSKTTDFAGKIALGILFAICLFSILIMFEVIKITMLESYLQ